jgi:hypothetical protein
MTNLVVLCSRCDIVVDKEKSLAFDAHLVNQSGYVMDAILRDTQTSFSSAHKDGDERVDVNCITQ